MKRLTFTTCTALLGLLLGATLAEIALRVIHPGSDGPVVRYTIQRNSKLFSAELDASSPLFYRYDGIRVEGDRLSIAYSDRRRRIVPLARAPGVFRIAAVGDSLTEQWDIPGYANYTNFLERLLGERRGGARVEVIPLGVGGYTTWQQRHLFERDLLGLEADLLLLQFCANDGDTMSLRPRAPGASVPEGEWPSWEIVGERFGRPDYSLAAIGPLHSRLLWRLRFGLLSPPALEGHRQVAGSEEQRGAFRWFRDLAARRGIPLVVAVFPLLRDGCRQAECAHVKSLLESLAIDYVDVAPALRARGSLETLARDLYHPTREGYRIAARAILDHLEARKLVPPR